ncbi:MAG TPA: 4-hydroxyphenylacetate 3-monooxygenase, oxygenase component [Symbiobacteriaceae bacterium]|jgi:4-hydroxyphenylacetate 3-monooxygenase
MPARTGQQYLDAINHQRREVYYNGALIATDVAVHPVFRGVTRSLAALYDMQHDPALRDEMTYVSPTSGDRVGISFLTPRTHDDLARRRNMIKRWHDNTAGMMGRSADYLSACLMGLAAGAEFMGQEDPRFAENARRYYEYVREHDLLLTHTLITPQANRGASTAAQSDPYLAAAVVRRTDEGIVIRGCRLLATLGPIADEIMVFPSTLLKATPEDEPYAYAFAIPCDTPGVKFICRESFDYGRSPFDHPLGSRFDEMDAIVVFDDVLVPWERVFMVGRPDLCNQLYGATNAVVHMTHQVVIKNVAKTEFLLGVILTIIETIGIAQFQHVQEKAAEAIVALEQLRAFLRAAEADADLDQYGVMTPAWAPLNAARNWYPKVYPRLVELIQLLSASGLMAIPGEADLASPETRPLLDRYLGARGADAHDRVRLFRLAWDIAASAFGQRQVLYERFFFGDPVRMAGALYGSYDKQPYLDRVRQFLEQSGRVEVLETADLEGGAAR